MFPVRLFAVFVSSMLSHAGGQSNGVCFMTVVETSTISVSVVVSNVQYYDCGLWSWSTCSRIGYSTQQVYTTISQNRSQFACCDGYLQVGTSQSCRSNTTSGIAIPQLNTVAVTTTGNSPSLHAIWSFSNNSNQHLSFNASCTTQDGSHQVDYSVGQSLSATFSELKPSTYYTCCVWAVVAGNAGPPTCAVQTRTQGQCDGFSNSSSCLNGSVCLEYYYNTTIMNCLCQMCRFEYVANETARAAVVAGDINSWAAPLVATLSTIIVVMVTLAMVVLLAHLVYRKARQRSSLQDETKANAAPSFELHHTKNETQHEHCDAAPLESEYTYVSTPECTGDKHTPVYANASESHSETRTKVGNSVHHKFTGSTVHLIKDEESRTAEESDYSTLDHTQDVAESPDRYKKLAHHATKDHIQPIAASPDKYNRVTHHAAKNQSDEVYSALNEGSETDVKVAEGYGILRGTIPKNTVNSNTSNDVYNSLLESNIPMQPSSINNPLYLTKALKEE